MLIDHVPCTHRARRSAREPIVLLALALATLTAPFALAQGGPGFPGGGQGPAGFGGTPLEGGPGSDERLEIVERFDADGDGFLDAGERTLAKEYLESSGWNARGRGPGGGRGGVPGGVPGGGQGGGASTGSPGVTITPDEVADYAGSDFYDRSVVRTIFIETGFDDWEAEMAAFYNTDVQLPVTATIDGVTYEGVGMRFRGNSSYSMVSAGLKRPIRLKLDEVVSGQSVEGVRTIKLLNGINDPSFLRTVLVSTIMQDYIAAPRANFVRLVVNGENWGIYQNQQHYNTDFLRDHFGEAGGVRWEVPGSPNGRGGMVYLGEDPDSYRSVYQIDNRDTAASWAALVELFRVLDQTPGDRLVAALEPILDIEGALRFLALDVVLANSDGFWTRASDYELYLAEDGRFHIIPHDLNEALGGGGSGGFGGGPGGGRAPGGGGQGGGAGAGTGNVNLDPLVGLNDTDKPLRSKLLAVPELQKRYLEIVLDIAERWLDWEVLGPMAEDLHVLIADDVERDTRKLYSDQQFQASLDGGTGSLRSFVEQRRRYLMSTVPALIEAIQADAYLAPVETESDAVSTVLEQAQANSLTVVGSTAYELHDGPTGWHLTAGSGQVVEFEAGSSGAAEEPAAAFVFDALSEGFGDSKLDQCLPIDATHGISIAYQVYADTPTADASGYGVRVNPNFHATLASCQEAMASDAGGDRLSGGRHNDDLDFVLGQDDGGRWLRLSDIDQPELAFAAADIPEGAAYLRLSMRARDRSDSLPPARLYIGQVSVTQEGSTVELLVNGDFGSP